MLLLRLQARSIALYLPESSVAEILVIDNSARGMNSSRRNLLLEDYGHLRSRVRILRPRDICEVPRTIGWRGQQVLKMAVAGLVTTDHYVLLDAKNHFVAPADPGFFLAPDGRARVNVYSYETHPLRPQFENVLRYLHLDPAEHVSHFTATVTPFVLQRSQVLSMMADIERRSGHSFAEEFVANDLLEFVLYSGSILAGGRKLEEVFDFHQVVCPVVWPRGANLENLTRLIAASDDARTPLFSLHRKALAALDEPSVVALAEFWAERGLFASPEQGVRYVQLFRKDFVTYERRRKVREAPHRLRARMRRRRPHSPADGKSAS